MLTETTLGPFDHLLGQQRARLLLERSLSSDRIAHAYLFRGPDGVGKKMFAVAMAKALNCQVSGPRNGCDQCVSCRKFASGNHPDYHVESPEKGVIKIGRVREVTASLGYPPYESLRRVVVMEDVHTMRAEAANSLLKTLEEPPEGNILILTAETAKNVLSTIRSRCQVIPFFPLTTEETVTILKDQHGLDEEESRVLARLAEGSPGRALILQKAAMVEIWKSLTSYLAIPAAKQDSETADVLKMAEQMAELKEDLPSFLGLLRLWVRDLLMKSAGTTGTMEKLFNRLEAIDLAEQQLGRNCNRVLVCEILIFRLQ